MVVKKITLLLLPRLAKTCDPRKKYRYL